MGVVTKIKDSSSGNLLKVNPDGTIVVVESAYPPKEESVNVKPFRRRFYNESSLVENMNVDGSVNPVDFVIVADEKIDIYIKTIFVEISDTGSPDLNKFGSLAALTNGVQWIYFDSQEGNYELHEGIKTNKEFIRLGIDTHGIGTGVDAYLADVSSGAGEKSYLPIIDFSETYGLKYGLKLSAGTEEKIIFRIRDNLSGLTLFDAIAYGIRVNNNL